MEVFASKADLREWIASRKEKKRVLVPTMGALHRGHTSLIDLASAESGEPDVIATLFVNPTQFGPDEDYASYPRTLEEDLEVCRTHGVDAVFQPSSEEIYAPDRSLSVRETRLSTRLCGASRPGHFDGVCLVVAKLFLLTQPDVAVFGEKDFQQLAVLRRMTRDLDFPISLVGAPTVREEDGLALSSRNRYLSARERKEAPRLFEVLGHGSERLAGAKPESVNRIRLEMIGSLEECSSARVDYLEVVDSTTLENELQEDPTTWRIVAAVYFGRTRLIDNVPVPPRSPRLQD